MNQSSRNAVRGRYVCRCDFHLHSPFIRREAELQALLTERYISGEHEQPVVWGLDSAAHFC